MPKNDVVLIDALLEKRRGDYPDLDSIGSVFDAFAFEQILKDYDLSYDEISSGWVDGQDDGGIDGFFVFLDGILLTDKPEEKNVRRFPHIDVVVLTCKHADTFRQVPINNLITSIQELFDLAKPSNELVSLYDEDLIQMRDLFVDTYKELSPRQPTLSIKFYYASRGHLPLLAPNVKARADYAETAIKELFSNCSCSFTFLGASELLALSRVQKSTSLRLKFIENYISRGQTNYIVLGTLSEYFKFVTDEEGKLRRYLFESNVRDFLGSTPVNQDISESLKASHTPEEFDFWWLNNGITIIASAANVAGKEISLENVQIVNGLQTTETLHKHFSSLAGIEDNRALLIKVVVTREPDIRDKIIKATNYQSNVELASLRATEKIQRDIEQILMDRNWYYDRRKNFYKNQGAPQGRIISPSYLASCIFAVVLKNPARGARLKTKFMRIDQQYYSVFNPNIDIRLFPIALEIVKQVEHIIAENPSRFPRRGRRTANHYRLVFSYMWISTKLGTVFYDSNDLLRLDISTVLPEEILKLLEFYTRVRELIRQDGSMPKLTEGRIYRYEPFEERLKLELQSTLKSSDIH